MTTTIVPLLDRFRSTDAIGHYRVRLAPDRRTAHIGPVSTRARCCALMDSNVRIKQGDTAFAVSFDEYGLEWVYVQRPDGLEYRSQPWDRQGNVKLLALRELLQTSGVVELAQFQAERVAELFQEEFEQLDHQDGYAFCEQGDLELLDRMAKAVVTWETREDGTVVGTLGSPNGAPKPIETTYAGFRFRSRLEARWAVALDALGIEWEYEPEGFETTAGHYLPDFRLPTLRAWLEIKPEPVEDPRHAAFASTLDPGWSFIVAAGNMPDPRHLDNPERQVTDFEALLIGQIPVETIRAAYTAGRSARFEHGESGA